MPFLGREFSSEPDYSDEIAREIDDEIRRVVEEAHQTAKDILTERREALERLSKILLARETIDAEQFVALLDGKTESEVFGVRGRRGPTLRPPSPSPSRRARREGPRPVPPPSRPGLERRLAPSSATRTISVIARPMARLMGIVNVTPDSFSDGGRTSTPRRRSPTAASSSSEGADILDVGGESTRPGAAAVTAEDGAASARSRWSRR